MNTGKIALAGLMAAILIFVIVLPSAAQRKKKAAESDSLMILNQDMDSIGLSKNIKTVYLDSATLKRPKIAAYYAAALPGLGQVYNKNYWKLPILYGGAAVMAYFVNWNNNKYHQYMQLLADKRSGITNQYTSQITVDRLTSGIDYYRRNRDYVMILISGLYLLQIVDAHVQAHLINFDINEDLTLRIEPVLEDSELMTRYVGLGIFLNIN